jgi:glycosyltransferase involved in cell wall biosynthesis
VTAPPLVVVDADVLGRQRTGDETHVAGLLRHLPDHSDGLRLAAATRRPELVPDGVEPLSLAARSQAFRMAWAFPRLLGRVGAALVHTQYALPLRSPCPAVVTIHDLHFERRPDLMSRKDRAVFKAVVPRAARRAARVLTVSARTRDDLVELYGVAGDRIVVIPNGVDERFSPGPAPRNGYALVVGAIHARKNPLAAVAAAEAAGLPLVVVGPAKDEALAAELARRGADVRGYVPAAELADLYRGAACLVLASGYEGFGLPVVEAMASGTPVVAAPDAALREVAGDAAVFAEPEHLGEGIRQALRDRDRLVAAGLERARLFSWDEAARRTAEVYREVLGR